jgi:hypothetical protein
MPRHRVPHLTIKDLHIVLTSKATSGVHLRTLNRAPVENIVIEGETNADAILIEGANSVTVIGQNLLGNRNGIHNVGIQLSGANYTPNAIKVYGGQITGNSNCGVLEDGSQVALVGSALGNSYDGVVFEDNGTDLVTTSGNACIQEIYGGSFSNDYFEYACTHRIPYSVWIGDSPHRPNSVVFTGNVFVSCGASATFNLANSLGVKIDGNIEVGATPTFIQNTTSAVSTWLGTNLFLAVADAGNKSPLIPGVSGPTTGILTANYTSH